MNEIIKQYNAIFWSQTKLTANDFDLNSLTPTGNKTWAIQIYNLDGTTPIANAQNQALTFPSSNYNVLANNALIVKINTTNSNVANQDVTIKGYLDKFIYTTKNLNKGHDISIDTSKTAQANHLEIHNVINLKNPQPPFEPAVDVIDLGKTKTVEDVKNEINNIQWNDPDKVEISRRIVTNLNNQLNQETQYLNNHHILRVASDNITGTTKNNFNIGDLQLYKVDNDGGVHHLIRDAIGIDSQVGWKIYLQLNISHWTYLNHYIAGQNPYVYFYLGPIANY